MLAGAVSALGTSWLLVAKTGWIPPANASVRAVFLFHVGNLSERCLLGWLPRVVRHSVAGAYRNTTSLG